MAKALLALQISVPLHLRGSNRLTSTISIGEFQVGANHILVVPSKPGTNYKKSCCLTISASFYTEEELHRPFCQQQEMCRHTIEVIKKKSTLGDFVNNEEENMQADVSHYIFSANFSSS